jgi:hypothetical protein
MDIDFNKLGKLVEKCSQSRVAMIKIGDIEVKFDKETEEKIAQSVVKSAGIQTELFSDLVKTNDEENKEETVPFVSSVEDDELLHLTDPVAWMKKEMNSDGDDSLDEARYSGGDEVDGEINV